MIEHCSRNARYFCSGHGASHDSLHHYKSISGVVFSPKIAYYPSIIPNASTYLFMLKIMPAQSMHPYLLSIVAPSHACTPRKVSRLILPTTSMWRIVGRCRLVECLPFHNLSLNESRVSRGTYQGDSNSFC